MIDVRYYASGPSAVAKVSASIACMELCAAKHASFEELEALSNLLFVRGGLLGRIADYDRAEQVANDALALSPGSANALCIAARLAVRFHRFAEAAALLDRALAAGYAGKDLDLEKAALLQATGRYDDALVLRERLAREHPGIRMLGRLATLLAEMNRWSAAEKCYAAALAADDEIAPLACGELLFDWAVSTMRRGDLEGAEELFVELGAILPAHVPARGHRAEIALARREFSLAAALIRPLLEVSNDPKYRAIHADILAACGERQAAMQEAERAAAAYEVLLARRPEAYAGRAAAFFMGIGNRPQRAVELASANWKRRDTPRSRSLLAKALRSAQRAAP